LLTHTLGQRTIRLMLKPYTTNSFGSVRPEDQRALAGLLVALDGLAVGRSGDARSTTPFPKSTDLEEAIKPVFVAQGFLHHHLLEHPRTGDRFEYDFWRPADGIAVEVMGYRADDEIYKDILKFHVHTGTRLGVVLVPRWKWISGRRTETNHKAALKALAFADAYMAVQALVAITYDWQEHGHGWKLLLAAG
jgi:hypothetical protein